MFTHSSMRPVNRHARAYTPPNQNRKCAVWNDVERTFQRPIGDRRELIGPTERAERHHQRKRRHHRVKVIKLLRIQCGGGLFGSRLAAPIHRVDARLHRIARGSFGRRLRPCGKLVEDGRRLVGPAERPYQVGRPHGRPSMSCPHDRRW